MKIKSIVTGGAGFIGSNLIERLLDLNHHVVCIDNESSVGHHRFYWSNCENHKVDICDFESIKRLFAGSDYVFHLAAEARIENCIADPLKTVRSNVLGTASVLQAAKQSGVKRLVYASTSSAYGGNPTPNKESQPDNCLNPYSVSKVSGEKLCSMYSSLFGLPTVILRYFNVYGKNQPSKAPYAPLIGTFLRQKKNGEALTIVGDGQQKRDFTNVKDVVEATILACTKELDDKWFGTVFNIGSGANLSVLEIANLISNVHVFVEKRAGEASETLADTSKAKELLGWQPAFELKKWIVQEDSLYRVQEPGLHIL